MSEHAPTPEEPSLEFTYGNCRDEAFHLLVASQWDEQTSGDPACDTGLFAHITNNIADADVLQAAWGKELAQIGTTVADITEALPTWLSGLSGVRRGGATKG